MDEVDAAGRLWQANASHSVVLVLAILGLPLIVCGLSGQLIVLPWPARWTALSVYAALVVALFVPRRHYRWRAAILVSSLYLLSALQLALNGLVGDGRIAVLILPLLSLILLGPREGWIAAAITTTMLAVFTQLAGEGTLARWQLIKENSLDPGHWLMQGLLLLGALIPLMILFTRFLALQRRTMIAERQSRRELEKEGATRRQLEGEILRVADEERRRLGAELHDGLGQDLLVISSQAQLSLCQDENPASTAGRLREIIETARQALEQTRRMAHNLRPGLLDELGFTKAVRAMSQKVGEASGIQIVVELADVDGLLPPESELNLYRITQEALNNVLKHARASEAKVTLSRQSACLRLVVEDNGRGFEPEQFEAAPPDRRGFGLHQIALRANMIEGRINIHSRPGQGTSLMVEVPVRISWSQTPTHARHHAHHRSDRG